MAFELGAADIDRIMELELKVCIPPIQTTKERLALRFSIGNRMLGYEIDEELVGTIGFRYAQFSPDDRSTFPDSFGEFSTPANGIPTVFNTAFIYSMNVDPKMRGKGHEGYKIGRDLIRSALATASHAGCTYAVADGRPSSYNGSHEYEQERHEQVPAFKTAIDRHLAGGEPIILDEVLLEPTLKFYHRISGGIKPLWVLENFFPADVPAGGHRIIVYGEL